MDKTINKTLLIISIILILLLVGVSSYTYSLRTDVNIANQNLKAKSDTLRTTKNKLGDVEKSKQVLVTKNKDLVDLNKDLKVEVDKEKGKVYNLTRIVAKLKNKPSDTIFINSNFIYYPDSSIGIKWNNDTIYDKYNYRNLSGESRFKYDSTGVVNLGTRLYTDDIGFNLITGLRKLNGKLEIFVRSDYPGFNVTQLDGAIIDPKKNPILKEFTKQKKWVIGPGIYIGLSGEGKLVPILGGGITYNLISF